jgi:hypothetical protein
MIKIDITKCGICGIEKNTPRALAQHIRRHHDLKLTDYVIKYYFNNNIPKCRCGCEGNVTIRGYQVMEYVDGHCPTGHYKKGQSPKRNYEKWKKNLVSGIRNYNNKMKDENPNYRSGENNNFFGKSHSESTKKRIREKIEEQIKNGQHSFIGNNNGRIGRSSLELKFEKYLQDNEIVYEQGYRVQYSTDQNKFPRNKYYDFYIPEINTLIEIHGSYWHPQRTENLTEMQLNNLKNDQFKKKLAKSRFYDILTIYDYELDDFIQSNCLLELLSDTDQNEVTISGYLKNSKEIAIPDYWQNLVDFDSITVHLTPIGETDQELYIESIDNNKVCISNNSLSNSEINCFFMVLAERSDIEKLRVEE